MNLAIEIVRVAGPRWPKREYKEQNVGDITMVREALKTHVDDPRCTAPNKAQIVIMNAPDGALKKFHRLTVHEYDLSDGSLDAAGDFVPTRKRPRALKFRAYHLPLAGLPVSARDKLRNPPYAIKVDWSVVRGAFIARKRDEVKFS